jgi:hypothetical protein
MHAASMLMMMVMMSTRAAGDQCPPAPPSNARPHHLATYTFLLVTPQQRLMHPITMIVATSFVAVMGSRSL